MAGSGGGAPVEACDEPECEGQDHAAVLALEEGEPVLARGYVGARTPVVGSTGGPCGSDGEVVVGARTPVAGSAGGPGGPDGEVVYDGSPEGNPLGDVDPVAASADGADVLSDASDQHGVLAPTVLLL